MTEKIQASHIEREAYVYIRQSTMQQVRTRLEGQRRQYDLRERAQALGFQRVVVVDEDLGRSGTGSVERPGFGRLLRGGGPPCGRFALGGFQNQRSIFSRCHPAMILSGGWP
jgi:hypothetical protein